MRSLVEKYTFHQILNLVNHFLTNYNPFYLVFNNMGHGIKFKQMRLCADFSAGPSKEYPLFFLLFDVHSLSQSWDQVCRGGPWWLVVIHCYLFVWRDRLVEGSL